MINCQKFNFLLFLTITVTTAVRELNGASQISLVTHDAKGEMREIYMRYRQVSRECKDSDERSSMCGLVLVSDDRLWVVGTNRIVEQRRLRRVLSRAFSARVHKSWM